MAIMKPNKEFTQRDLDAMIEEANDWQPESQMPVINPQQSLANMLDTARAPIKKQG